LKDEDDSSARYEFLDGYIRDIGYATDAHETLVTNFVALLHYLLRKTNRYATDAHETLVTNFVALLHYLLRKTNSKVYISNRLLYVEAYNRYFTLMLKSLKENQLIDFT
jgi:hypothetical protein